MSQADLPPVAILAGGLGTRLRAVVPDRPKVLAQVNDRPFLSYLLDQINQAGGTRVVLLTGYAADQVEEQFGDEYAAMDLLYSREPEPLGTGGAVRLALPLLDAEYALVLNGDSYCGLDLAALATEAQTRQVVAALATVEVPDIGRFGAVETNDNGLITRFVEKGGGSGPGAINAGVYCLSRDMIESIPEGEGVSLETEVFPGWLRHGCAAWPAPGPFIDIGTPASYAAAERFFEGLS